MAGEPLLQLDSEGLFVARLQRALNSAGFDVGLIDGLFKAKTKSAVEEFQSARGLNVDGVVGNETWPEVPTHVVRIHAKFMSIPETISFGRMVREMRASYGLVGIGVEIGSTEVLPQQDLLDNLVLENDDFGPGATTPEQDTLFTFDSFVSPRDIPIYFVDSIVTPDDGKLAIAPKHPPGFPAILTATFRSATPPVQFNPGMPYSLAIYVGRLCGLTKIDQAPDCLPDHLMSDCLWDEGVSAGPAILTDPEGQAMKASSLTRLIDEPPGIVN